MPGHDLYLFKAAHRPLYRKETPNLLAAKRGTVVDLLYDWSWIAPECGDDGEVPRGTRVFILFTDRPYDLFVPVRQGKVLGAAWDEFMLRLRVVLGNLIGVESDVGGAALAPSATPAASTVGGARITGAADPPGLADLLAFTRAIRDAVPAGRVPGDKFVTPKLDAVLLVAYYDDRADLGWRRAVDHILALSRRSADDHYGWSIFRPPELRVDGEAHVARRVPLPPGAAAALRIGFYNPHLAEGDVARHELRVLAPPESLTVDAPKHFPAMGEVEIALEVRGPDPTRTVQIGPTPAEHTTVTKRLATRAASPRPDLAPAPPAMRRATRRSAHTTSSSATRGSSPWERSRRSRPSSASRRTSPAWQSAARCSCSGQATSPRPTTPCVASTPRSWATMPASSSSACASATAATRRNEALGGRYLNKRILIAGAFKNLECVEKLRHHRRRRRGLGREVP